MDHPGQATQLRYQFGTLAQARAHVRESDGRWLFFYRAEKLRLLPYAPVCVELGFDDGSTHRLLHGQAMDSLEGAGTWIEVQDARPVTSVAEHTRKLRRLGCDFPVEVRSKDRNQTGRLLDLSLGGARIAGVDKLFPPQEVEIRLLSGDRLTFRDLSFGTVAWAGGNELGVKFDAADAIGRMAVGKLFATVEAGWRKAWGSAHPLFCCKSGAILEPEPPRLRREDDITGKIAL